MRFREKLSFGFILGSAFLLSSCGTLHTLASQILDQSRQREQAQDADHLVEVARAYTQVSQAVAAPSVVHASKRQIAPSAGSEDEIDQENDYKTQIMMDLAHKDYDALDQAALADRSPTARFGGGSWRVWGYYEGLDTPPTGDSATDDDWNAQIDALKAWVAARPESAAARIALAGAYDNFGSKARGGGYADSVSDEGWKLYDERLAMTASTLVDAAKLKERDPYWFSLMYDVALAQGWSKSQAKALLDAAISFEPSYYHVYRQYANFLLPKWYGEPGDAQAFANSVSTRIGGKEGDFVYFEIATTVACGCDPSQDGAGLQTLSWPKIKDGYAAMGQLYGYSSLKANRFAYLAVLEHDKPAAEAAFAAIGDDWDSRAWPAQTYFQQAKAWAENPQGQ
ncbi:MAG: hypothetical protein ACLP3K_09760 [Candidatus Acidiferrales bacterium]